jgi:hypothetical protein
MRRTLALRECDIVKVARSSQADRSGIRFQSRILTILTSLLTIGAQWGHHPRVIVSMSNHPMSNHLKL